jgi:hypothetical protein
VLHHVGIEVAPADVERTVELLELLGFRRVPVPEGLGDGFTWLEREGTQVHLMHEEDPIVPPRGHLAVVAPAFEATLASLAERGFRPERRREHWGAPRAVVPAPGGQRVELMAAPPARRGPDRA